MFDKTPASLFSPVRSGGLSEAIVRRIGELIGSGVLRAGDRLPTEVELAAAFDVAPMTVRLALQALREHDLIETRRGRGAGTFVREHVAGAPYFHGSDLPSVEDFLDFTIWREAVSGEACFRAALAFKDGRIDAEQRSTLQRLTDASHRHGMNPEDFRFADAELHRYIAELSGSPRLVEAERSIQASLTSTLRYMAQPPDSDKFPAQGHSALIGAITAGLPEEARERLREHARSTVDLMVGLNYLRLAEAEVQA